jgi:hypothetical protein
MEVVMKKILSLLILSFLVGSVYASDIYTYTDKDGNMVISNTPVPDKYEKKAKKVESDNNIQGAETSPDRIQTVDNSSPAVYASGGSAPESMTKTEKKDCARDCEMDLHQCESSCQTHPNGFTKGASGYITKSEISCKKVCQVTYRSCKSECR